MSEQNKAVKRISRATVYCRLAAVTETVDENGCAAAAHDVVGCSAYRKHRSVTWKTKV